MKFNERLCIAITVFCCLLLAACGGTKNSGATVEKTTVSSSCSLKEAVESKTNKEEESTIDGIASTASDSNEETSSVSNGAGAFKLPETIETGDFLLIDGLSFSASEGEGEKVLGTDYSREIDSTAGIASIKYDDLRISDQKTYAEFVMAEDGIATAFMQVYLDGFAFLHDSESSVREVFKKITERGDVQYEGRSKKLFSSVKELENLYADYSNLPKKIGSILNGMQSFIDSYRSMYETEDINECLSEATGWLVDDTMAVYVMCNGKKISDKMIIIGYLCPEKVLATMTSMTSEADLSEEAFQNARFGLPEGVTF